MVAKHRADPTMLMTPDAASGRPGLLCAALATAVLASAIVLIDALVGPSPLAATERQTAHRDLEQRLAAHSPDRAGDFTRPQAGVEGGGLSLAISDIVAPSDAAELKGAIKRADFRLAAIREGEAEVPRLYVAALPPDLPDIDEIETRKQVFLGSVLPLVLLANEELRQRRARLLDLVSRLETGEEVAITDRAWLDALAEHYEVEHGDFSGLKLRVAEIPPSLALAQAIVESGWGTSRFALEGNALFGQRTWSAEALAIVPERNRSVRVKAFIDLMDSVRAYMHNLNTHGAYVELRSERARLAATGQGPGGAELVYGLESYAEIDGYVEKLQALMRDNKLAELDDAALRSRSLTALAFH